MKKRRLSWIVGSVVTVALFGAWATLAKYNSTDARIERAVAQIVEEYGFQFQSQGTMVIDSSPRGIIGKTYLGAAVGGETLAEIVAILREACPSCKYTQMSGGDPGNEVHELSPDQQDGGFFYGIQLFPDRKDYGRSPVEPHASLSVFKLERPSLWQRIKGLWPW